MSLRFVFSEPSSLRIVLLLLAALALIAAYLLRRKKGSPVKRPSHAGPIVLNLGSEPLRGEEEGHAVAPRDDIVDSEPQVPVFWTLASHHTLIFDTARIALVLLALAVAGGLILVILPQSTVGRFEQLLGSRTSTVPRQEMIAFLYLGDEVKNDQFVINGAVRNISTEPIEKLDAGIRLYSAAGELLESVIVRMDKETIAPDEVAQFHLSLTGFRGQYGSYAIDFRLRQGDVVPYKDMRGPKTRD